MSDDYKAGLTDDELSQFPSAANPLTAMGLDPDEVAANPELLAGLDLRNSGSNARVPYRDSSPASSPSPSAVAPAAPASDEPTDPESYGLAGLKRGYKNLESAAKSADEMSTEPPADLARLTAQREKLATPAPRFDPSSGKPLATTQEYDPQTRQMVSVNPQASRGQKVWRGVRSGLAGLLTGGIPGAALGALEPQDIRGGTAYNAPSKAYTQAEQRREEQLGATDTGIKNALQTWKDVNEARKAKAGEYRAAAGQDKDIVTGATGLINAENKPESEENKTKAKLELSDKEFQQRRVQADRLGLRSTQRALYIANGKLPDPRQPAAEELALAKASRAFVAQNGRDPQTLEEFNQVASAAKGALDKSSDADKIKNENLRTATRAAEKHLKDLQDLQKHALLLPREGKQDLAQKIKDAQDEYDDLQSQLTGGTKTPAATQGLVTLGTRRGGSQATALPTAPAAPIPPANTPKNQFTVTVPGAGAYNFPTQQAADQFKKAAGIQ